MRIKLFKNNKFQSYRIILYLIVLIFCCGTIYATDNYNNSNANESIVVSSYIATSSEIATNSNTNVSNDSSSNDSYKFEINVNNNNINVEVTNDSNKNNGSSSGNSSSSGSSSESSYNLKEIAGYKRDEKILKEIKNDETAKSMFNDLLHELKPYLTDLIDENISEAYNFTTSDTIEIVVFHPVRFLSALKDYVANSLKEIFAIAEENSEIVTK